MRPNGVWAHRDFTRLWTAATVSAFGTDVTINAFPFAAILVLHASPWQLGLLRIASKVPAFVVGIVAGTLLDRVRRRPVMIACDWFRAAVLISIPVGHWLFHLTLAHLLIAAVLISIASTFFDIADRAMLPTLVGREDVVDANRMLTAGNTVAETTGFAVSGWLVQAITAPGALLIDAATFVWSGLTLRRIRKAEEGRAGTDEPDHFLREALRGLRYVQRNPTLVGLGLSLFVMSLSTDIVGTVYLLYVNQELGFSPGPLGIMFATGGIFSLLASLTSGRLMKLVGIGPLLIATLLFVSAGQSLITLATSVGAFAVIVMLLQQSMDFPWTLYIVTAVSTRQVVTPDGWQGRMNGSFHVLEFGGYLLGAIAGAWIGSSFGLRAAILTGAGGMALATIPLLVTPVRGLRAMPAPPPA